MTWHGRQIGMYMLDGLGVDGGAWVAGAARGPMDNSRHGELSAGLLVPRVAGVGAESAQVTAHQALG